MISSSPGILSHHRKTGYACVTVLLIYSCTAYVIILFVNRKVLLKMCSDQTYTEQCANIQVLNVFVIFTSSYCLFAPDISLITFRSTCLNSLWPRPSRVFTLC